MNPCRFLMKNKAHESHRGAVIMTTNPGCLLQMKFGIEREELIQSMLALHLIDLLAEVAGSGY